MTSECLNCNHRDHESCMVYQNAGGFLCRACDDAKSQCKTALHSDPVNHPSHYKGHGLECIQVIEAFELGFNLGNAIKYTLRAGKKGSKVEDLKKALWYIQRQIDFEEKYDEK